MTLLPLATSDLSSNSHLLHTATPQTDRCDAGEKERSSIWKVKKREWETDMEGRDALTKNHYMILSVSHNHGSTTTIEPWFNYHGSVQPW